MARGLVVLLCAMSLACTDPEGPADAGRDAGRDAGSDAGPGLSPVAEPGLPRLTCPPGWVSETLADVPDVQICDPFDGPRIRCTGAAAHFPGETGCRAIGTPCPSDGLPEDVPSDALFVLAGSLGGDGTRAAPFATIREALDVVADAGTIAVGVGRYEEAVILMGRSFFLRGACPDTVITTPRTVVTASDADVDVSNLTIEGGTIGVYAQGGTATVSDVLILGSGTGADLFLGGQIEMRDVVIRDVMQGISTRRGGIVLERFAMENVADLPLSASSESATIVMTDGVIDGTPVTASGLASVFGGSAVTLERVAVRSEGFGQVIVTSGSRLALTDVSIRAGALAPEDPFGIIGLEGSSIELSRVFIEGSPAFAVGVGDPDTTLEMSDTVVFETNAVVIGRDGHGIEVDGGAFARITRSWIESAAGIGVLASGGATEVVLDDLVVRNTRDDGAGVFGRALQVQLGAHVTSSRTRFAGNREATVVVATPGSRWDATDAVIEDSLERACAVSGCPPGGIGVSVFESGSARIERFRIRRAALVGAQVAFDGSLVLTDGEVSECPVGANVQVPGYDLDTLRDRVVYRDNGTNLDSSELVIPEPIVPRG